MVTTQEPGSCTLVAVGERAHVPGLAFELVQEYRLHWDRCPVGAMLNSPAFVGGATGTRFERYGAVARYRVNLLPPDRKCGTWETGLARHYAFKLATEWPVDDLGAPRFLLMGRRVVDAFTAGQYGAGDSGVCYPNGTRPGGQAPFGTIFFAWDRPCIALPHPSGRSRWWNEEGRQETVRRWVDLFSRCFCS